MLKLCLTIKCAKVSHAEDGRHFWFGEASNWSALWSRCGVRNQNIVPECLRIVLNIFFLNMYHVLYWPYCHFNAHNYTTTYTHTLKDTHVDAFPTNNVLGTHRHTGTHTRTHTHTCSCVSAQVCCLLVLLSYRRGLLFISSQAPPQTGAAPRAAYLQVRGARFLSWFSASAWLPNMMRTHLS